MKKRIIGLTLILCVAATPAFASDCYAVNKPDGAGNIGNVYVTIDPRTGQVSETLPTNPGGQTKGGFVDVYVNGTLVVNDNFLLSDSPGLTKEGGLPEIPVPSSQQHNGNGVDHYH